MEKFILAPDKANHSRRTATVYPDGTQLDNDYGSSGAIDGALNRVRSIKEDVSILAQYSYLGNRPVIVNYVSEPKVELTYFTSGGSGDGGDQYTGLDRFGRIVDQRWRRTTNNSNLERIQYGYDRLSSRKWSQSLMSSSQSELYAYDGLNQLQELRRGTLNVGKTGIVGTPSREENWNYDPSRSWHGSGTVYLVKQSGSTVLNQNRTHKVEENGKRKTMNIGKMALFGFCMISLNGCMSKSVSNPSSAISICPTVFIDYDGFSWELSDSGLGDVEVISELKRKGIECVEIESLRLMQIHDVESVQAVFDESGVSIVKFVIPTSRGKFDVLRGRFIEDNP